MPSSRELPGSSERLWGGTSRYPRGAAPVYGRPAGRTHDEEGLIAGILRDGAVCQLVAAAAPAVGAMCLDYGYRAGLLYCQTEPGGWQAGVLRQHPEVRFVIAPERALAAAPVLALWDGQQVVGTGWAGVVEDTDGQREGLDAIMAHTGRPVPLWYADEVLRHYAVIRVTVHQWRAEVAPPGGPPSAPAG